MSQEYNPKENEDWYLVAEAFGFRNWKTIYDHEKNKSLRERKDPYTLSKDDKIFIPDKQPAEHKCETNKRHTFTLPTPMRPFSVEVVDDDGDPYADAKYELWIDGEKYLGKGDNPDEIKRTDSNGLICKELPLTVEKFEIRIWLNKETENDPDAYDTLIEEPGHLDPIDTVEGVQHRLEKLGYFCGEDKHGELGPGTKEALINFQTEFELDPSGEIDEKTKDILLEVYDRG